MSSRSYKGKGQGFCDDCTKALVLKTLTKGRVSKNVINCVTSFMDDLIVRAVRIFSFFVHRRRYLYTLDDHVLRCPRLLRAEVQRASDQRLDQVVHLLPHVCGLGGLKSFHFGRFSQRDDAGTASRSYKYKYIRSRLM